MALTPQKIRAITVLKDLSEDQITAITNLSNTDEQAAIDEATGKAYGFVDTAINELLGTTKPHGKPTSEYVKDSIKKLKEQSQAGGDEALKAKIKELETQVKTLEKSAKEGDGGQSKVELERTQKELEQLKTNYAALEDEKKKALLAKDSELQTLRNSQFLDTGLAGITFISEDIINPETRQMAIELEKRKILEQYDIVEENGKRRFIDKATKMPLVDPENLAQDMSVNKLMSLRLKGLVDTTKHVGGGGSTGGGGEGGGNGIGLDLKGIKSKTQAHKAVSKYLGEKGLVAGTPQFQQEMDKVWRENKLSELPTHAPSE